MKSYTATEIDADAIVEALRHGDGAVRITGPFPPEDIAEARRIVMEHSNRDAGKATHFQGAAEAEGRIALQRRVWNLLAKGKVFTRMAAHPALMAILRKFLGTEFIMGSIAANRILSGGPEQEPHIDYPYWNFHAPETHPTGLNSSFPVNAQVSVILDPFTEQSGTAAYVPCTQRELRYPTQADDFHAGAARMIGDPGDVALFFGAVRHCAMPNRSDHDRRGILIQYLPKWVKPMEDVPAALPAAVVDGASPDLRPLLGLNYSYPDVLESAAGRNAEGRT